MKICHEALSGAKPLPSITHLYNALSKFAEKKLREGDQYLIERLHKEKCREPGKICFTLSRNGKTAHFLLHLDFHVRCFDNVICGPTAKIVVDKMANVIKEYFDGRS